MKIWFPGAFALLIATSCTISTTTASPSYPAVTPPSRAAATPSAPTGSGDGKKAAAAMLGRLIRDNTTFVQSHPTAYFQSFQNDQHPRATVVACADSRFHLQSIDSSPDGDIFEIHNIGNQIDGTEGSVEYGIHHLHTPLLLIIGHVGCGAVKAALGDYGEEPAPIRRELDGLHLSIRRASEIPAQDTFEAKWLAGVLANVHQQVQNALHEYAEAIHAGELFVVGAVYDFRDDLHQGKGRLHIIDINGETSPERLNSTPLLIEAKQLASAP